MDASSWFDTPVIGDLPPEQAIIKLREIGEYEMAEQLEKAEKGPFRGSEASKWWIELFKHKRHWLHTSHAFGHIQPDRQSRDFQSIAPIESVQPDARLCNTRIKITLNRLRVADYPGDGIHHVLLHFSAQHQVARQVEPLHFSTTYRVKAGESAGVRGYPLFIGLNVGYEGLTLKCRTINVSDSRDEALLGLMENDTFKAGLQILSTINPVVPLFSGMILGLANSMAKRSRNTSVQDFALGLGFNALPMEGRLAEGAYLAVQYPENEGWNWDEWVYLPAQERIVKRNDHQQVIPYNYIVFGISRCE